MVRNYFDGMPPRPADDETGDATEVRDAIKAVKAKCDEEFNSLAFSRALETVWTGIARVDKFITDNEPWKLAKDPAQRSRLEMVIATAYEGLRFLVLLAAPVLPESTREIWTQMGLAGEPLKINPNSAQWGEPIEVSKIERISPVYPKLNKEKIMAEIEKEKEAAAASSQQPATEPSAAASTEVVEQATAGTEPAAGTAGATQAARPTTPNVITIDDFAKVDAGEEKPRQILAGIAQHYAPDDVIGRKIVVVTNLAPRKLRGLESNGMLLAASVGEEGRPVLVTFTEDVPNGARLK
jgi:methionyl-tRNA synthetase